VSGVYKTSTIVNDSQYACKDLRTTGVYLSDDPRFELLAVLHIEQLSLYSVVFIGITDGAFATPFGNSGNIGVTAALGQSYDGPYLGLYASNGTDYSADDSIRPGLLQANRTYRLRCVAENGSADAYLYNSSGSLLAFVTVPYNPSQYAFHNLNYFSMTIKGYSDDYGAGARLKCNLDSINIVDTHTSTIISTPSLPGKEPALIGIVPNPFHASCEISVADADARNLLAVLYDLSGKPVVTLNPSVFRQQGSALAARLEPGDLPSGAYILRVRVQDQWHSRTLLLLR
jgi:hypothetical protein